MKNLFKKCSMLILCLTILFVSMPSEAMAAGEPGNGYYRIKNLATGQYLSYSGSVPYYSSNMDYSVWIVENTTGSNKWFAIRPAYDPKLALTFPDEDSTGSAVPYIPGNVSRYDPAYRQFTRQRFSFGLTRSGYNIFPIEFSDNVYHRVIDSVGTIYPQLKKASGARSQIFVLEYVGAL